MIPTALARTVKVTVEVVTFPASSTAVTRIVWLPASSRPASISEPLASAFASSVAFVLVTPFSSVAAKVKRTAAVTSSTAPLAMPESEIVGPFVSSTIASDAR